MLKRVAIAVLSLVVMAALAAWLLAGNGPTVSNLPKPLRSVADSAVRLTTGTDPYWRCWTKVRSVTGEESYQFDYPQDCYRFFPSRVYAGVYMDYFENQQFVEGAAGPPAYSPRTNVQLHLDQRTHDQLICNLPVAQRKKSRVWQVVFSGRQANEPSSFGPGHLQDALIVVDQLKSAKLITSFGGSRPCYERN